MKKETAEVSPVKVAVLPKVGIFKTKISEGRKVKVVGGYESELLKIIFQYLQLPYEVLIPEELEWGVKKEDGTWNGLIGSLNASEADMAIGATYLTEIRSTAAEYSYPYNIDKMFFVTRKPTRTYPPLTLLNPFTTSLWFCMSISLLILIVICRYFLSRKYSWQLICLNVLQYVLRQPMGIRETSVSGRMLLATLMLGGFIFSLSYASVLLSFLTVPTNEKVVEDIQTLICLLKKKEIKVYIAGGKSIYHILSSHNYDENVRFLTSVLSKNKWILDQEPDILQNYIITERNALLTTQNLLQNMPGYSNLLVSEDHFQLFPICIMFKKGFIYKDKINQIIHHLAASGIYKKNVNDYFFLSEQRSKSFGHKTENKLTFTKIKGAFIVLLVGYGLSLCTFLAEFVYFLATNSL